MSLSLAILYVYVPQKSIGRTDERKRVSLCNVYVDVGSWVWYHSLGGDMMPISEARKRANIAYNRRQDAITLRPSKEEGREIREAAAKSGKSVQRYILDILRANR